MSLKIYPPVLIYLCLSLIQIVLDLMKGMYNTGIMKIVVVIMVSFLLHILCVNDLCVISWIIVFIPFILMSIIISMLLYIFGLNISYGIANSSSAIITTPTLSNTNTSSKTLIIAPIGKSDPQYIS